MNDKVKVTLKSGKGGDGAIAYRRERCVENGGPYGGNGGKGGSIFLVADNGIDSLANYRFGKTIFAPDGENGRTKLQYGKDGDDVYLQVPVGTVVEDLDGHILADLYHHGDTYLAAKGGRGGRGNATFKSPTHRTPNIAENGLPGEIKDLYFELKMLADVGLVGYPNAGKSTLLDAVTRAHPQIADYAFTTLEPQLGVCFVELDKPFVIADLPGLIEGASEGKGLGFTFLRHIERCMVLLHVIDLSSDMDPYLSFANIQKELFQYSDLMRKKAVVIALNKTDLIHDREKIEKLKQQVSPTRVFAISAKDEKGLTALTKYLYKLVQAQKKQKKDKFAVKGDEEEKVYRAKNNDTGRIPSYRVVQREDGYFEILGERVVRTKRLINLKTDEGMDRLLSYLDRIGIDRALKNAGCKNGDTVVLDDFAFEYFE